MIDRGNQRSLKRASSSEALTRAERRYSRIQRAERRELERRSRAFQRRGIGGVA